MLELRQSHALAYNMPVLQYTVNGVTVIKEVFFLVSIFNSLMNNNITFNLMSVPFI